MTSAACSESPGPSGNTSTRVFEGPMDDVSRAEQLIAEGVDDPVAGFDARALEHVGVDRRLVFDVLTSVEHGCQALAHRRERHHRGLVVQGTGRWFRLEIVL